MIGFNPCVTGDTVVLTVDGYKTFAELAETGDDVMVYCLDHNGEIRISKMFHPRKTGHNVQIVEITLSDGSVFKMTENHLLLTKDGYSTPTYIFNDDDVCVFNLDNLPTEVEECVRKFSDYTGMKSGNVLKTSETSGIEFEVEWDLRECCCADGEDDDMIYMIDSFKKNILHNFCGKSGSLSVVSVAFKSEPEDVFNGTVAVYHNYFIVDKNTNTIVNNMNCGQ